MSSPNPTSLMADWLSDNLADWLHNEDDEPRDMVTFVQRCVLPHLSSYGVNSAYEFVKQDYDEDEVALNWDRMPNPEREGTA